MYVSVRVDQLIEVDTPTQEFKASFELKARWEYEGELPADCNGGFDSARSLDIDWSTQWNPKLYVRNTTREARRVEEFTLEKGLDGKTYVIMRIMLRAIMFENLELWDVPVDTQDLSILLCSHRPAEELILVIDETHPTRLLNGLVSSNFLLSEYHLIQDLDLTPSIVSDEDYSLSRIEYPLIKITLEVEREGGFYVLNMCC